MSPVKETYNSNSVEISKIDIKTLSYLLSQFQIVEEHKEANT